MGLINPSGNCLQRSSIPKLVISEMDMLRFMFDSKGFGLRLPE